MLDKLIAPCGMNCSLWPGKIMPKQKISLGRTIILT